MDSDEHTLVNVPVLSEHIVLTDPRVSTTFNDLHRILFRFIILATMVRLLQVRLSVNRASFETNTPCSNGNRQTLRYEGHRNTDTIDYQNWDGNPLQMRFSKLSPPIGWLSMIVTFLKCWWAHIPDNEDNHYHAQHNSHNGAHEIVDFLF